jgi:hypothetical protein
MNTPQGRGDRGTSLQLIVKQTGLAKNIAKNANAQQ